MSWIIQETYYGVKELLRISRSEGTARSFSGSRSKYPICTMTDAWDSDGLYDEEEIKQRKEEDFPLQTMAALNEMEKKLRSDNLYGSRLVSNT